LDRLVRLFPKIDLGLYLAFSIACVSFAAHTFYGYMHVQTSGMWSAPLDDVFIHFDYARATARGYPFQWSEGNGFSSGNTSITYPFVLAVGYWAGFRGLLLMKWAAIVACASVFAFLGLSAALFKPLGRWAKYLLPPVALCVGALDWSLFSGMENAFHLATWALMLAASLAVIGAANEPKKLVRSSLVAGLAGALLFLTRPESAVCVAAFTLWAALSVRARRASEGGGRARFPWGVFFAMSVPGAIAFAAQSIANRVFTGEWAAAGALAKLALNHPYMTASDKWEQYTSLLRYVVLRNTHHHFADFGGPEHPIPWGWLVPLAALLPFFVRETRGVAAMLWAQVIGWLALVSLNGQVRWQNERYTMPAVAWLLVLAALGLAALISGPGVRSFGKPARALIAAAPERQTLVFGALRVAGALAIAAVFWRAQLPRMRDQIWFFGRASRNIRDQHIVAGGVLKRLGADRVLVGDAGALLYSADIAGIDLIGLGGYHDLPFARAGVHGLGASLELIERVDLEDRPDAMALYPGWWGDLPAIFGRRVAAVPVFGNVICGGSEKVIYRADWAPLDRLGRPRALRRGERVLDEVDVADLVSEKAHGYVFPHPAAGFVDFRVLADPGDRTRDLFDAGRVIGPGQGETMRVLTASGPQRLLLRVTPEMKAKIDVQIDGRTVGQIVLAGVPDGRAPAGGESKEDGTRRAQSGAWLEAALDLPDVGEGSADLALVAAEGAFTDFHVWIVTSGGGDSAD
jgi:hypothetical protein